MNEKDISDAGHSSTPKPPAPLPVQPIIRYSGSRGQGGAGGGRGRGDRGRGARVGGRGGRGRGGPIIPSNRSNSWQRGGRSSMSLVLRNPPLIGGGGRGRGSYIITPSPPLPPFSSIPSLSRKPIPITTSSTPTNAPPIPPSTTTSLASQPATASSMQQSKPPVLKHSGKRDGGGGRQVNGYRLRPEGKMGTGGRGRRGGGPVLLMNKLPVVRYSSSFNKIAALSLPMKSVMGGVLVEGGRSKRRTRLVLAYRHPSYSWRRPIDGPTTSTTKEQNNSSNMPSAPKRASYSFSYGHHGSHSLSRFYSLFETAHSRARRTWGLKWQNGRGGRGGARAGRGKSLGGRGPFARTSKLVRPRSRNMTLVRQGAKCILRVKRKVGMHFEVGEASFESSHLSILNRYRRSKKGNSIVRSQTTLTLKAVTPASAPSSPSKLAIASAKEDPLGLASLVRGLQGRKLLRARQAVQQAIVHTRNKSLNRKKKLEYCLFFNRFGRCKQGEECHYLHDKTKIGVCRKFLQGKCIGKGLGEGDGSCLLSHAVTPEKMPTCAFFVRGACNNDDCPYSHVKVNEKAELCPDFLKGYCGKGTTCPLKHITTSEQRSAKGERKKGTKRGRETSTSGDQEKHQKLKRATEGHRDGGQPSSSSKKPGRYTETDVERGFIRSYHQACDRIFGYSFKTVTSSALPVKTAPLSLPIPQSGSFAIQPPSSLHTTAAASSFSSDKQPPAGVSKKQEQLLMMNAPPQSVIATNGEEGNKEEEEKDDDDIRPKILRAR